MFTLVSSDLFNAKKGATQNSFMLETSYVVNIAVLVVHFFLYILIRSFIQFSYPNRFMMAACAFTTNMLSEQHEYIMEIRPFHCNDEILRSGHKNEHIQYRQYTNIFVNFNENNERFEIKKNFP